MSMRSIALLAVLLAAAIAHAQSNVYRWVDKDGKVHFSDAPPAEDAKDVSQRRMGGGQGDEPQVPYATQVAMKRNPVTFYTHPQCGDLCDSGRQLLTARGIPFTEHSVESREEVENVRKQFGPEIPLLKVGETVLKGYSDSEWQAALDSAGYPRTRLPGQGGAQRQEAK